MKEDNNKSREKQIFIALQLIESNSYLDQYKAIKDEIAKQTGFSLKYFKIGDNVFSSDPTYNAIIDEIKASEFIIADISFQNENVFYEAGYAQALEKKVYYVCNKNHFSERIKIFYANRFSIYSWQNEQELIKLIIEFCKAAVDKNKQLTNQVSPNLVLKSVMNHK